MTPIATPKAHNALRSVRHRAGMTQKTLSVLTGLPVSTIARIDKDGTSKMTLDQALRLAAALHVNVTELLPR